MSRNNFPYSRMKRCIWCKKSEETTPFTETIHIISSKIGGEQKIENCCDECNHIFGDTPQGKLTTSIDGAQKDVLFIQREILLSGSSQWSEIHKATMSDGNWRIKESDKFRRIIENDTHHAHLTKQFKKSMYKSFLEANENRYHDSIHHRYDFIRDYVLNDIDDLPVFLYTPIIFITERKSIETSQLMLGRNRDWCCYNNLVHFQEFYLLGLLFGVATKSDWKSKLIDYAVRTDSFKNGEVFKFHSTHISNVLHDFMYPYRTMKDGMFTISIPPRSNTMDILKFIGEGKFYPTKFDVEHTNKKRWE